MIKWRRSRDYRSDEAKRFGARFRQAISMALRKVTSSTASNRTEVLPRFPQAPLAGVNIFG